MTDVPRRIGVLEETIARMEPLLIRIDECLNHVATKTDLETMRADTDTRMESLRGDTTRQIETLRSDTAKQIETLRADTATQIETLRADLRAGLAEKPGRFFMVGTVMTVFGLCAAIVAATVAALHFLQPLP
jgi:hypothetical protein